MSDLSAPAPELAPALAPGLTIARERPTGPDLALLMASHTEAMHADTPPESIHMMDASALDHPEIRFLVLRENGAPIGMGAIKRIAPGEGEIKSMHVLAETRGRGLARVMLAHLVAEARDWGLTRLSLETGSQASFAAARGLYLAAGFEDCAPFGSYRPDPMSTFMTRVL